MDIFEKDGLDYIHKKHYSIADSDDIENLFGLDFRTAVNRLNSVSTEDYAVFEEKAPHYALMICESISDDAVLHDMTGTLIQKGCSEIIITGKYSIDAENAADDEDILLKNTDENITLTYQLKNISEMADKLSYIITGNEIEKKNCFIIYDNSSSFEELFTCAYFLYNA